MAAFQLIFCKDLPKIKRLKIKIYRPGYINLGNESFELAHASLYTLEFTSSKPEGAFKARF